MDSSLHDADSQLRTELVEKRTFLEFRCVPADREQGLRRSKSDQTITYLERPQNIGDVLKPRTGSCHSDTSFGSSHSATSDGSMHIDCCSEGCSDGNLEFSFDTDEEECDNNVAYYYSYEMVEAPLLSSAYGACVAPAWQYCLVPVLPVELGSDTWADISTSVSHKGPQIVKRRRSGTKGLNAKTSQSTRGLRLSANRMARCDLRQAESCSTVVDNLDGEEWTTLIFRNVPGDCTRDALAKMLDQEGFTATYDFIHVPVSFQNFIALGYGIVNMVDHDSAERAIDHFRGPTSIACSVDWNHPGQGLVQHIDRYRNSPMMHASVPPECKPALYRNGHVVDFPAPTMRLRPPRVRHQKPAVLA